MVVEPDARPDEGLHEDEGHEVDEHAVQELVNSLECSDTLACRVILENILFIRV